MRSDLGAQEQIRPLEDSQQAVLDIKHLDLLEQDILAPKQYCFVG